MPTWVVAEFLAEAVERPTLVRPVAPRPLKTRGFVISPRGVRALAPFRVGATISTRRALAQLTAATTGLVTEPPLEGPFGFCHFAARPGDLVAAGQLLYRPAHRRRNGLEAHRGGHREPVGDL